MRPRPNQENVRREFILVVWNDGSISIETTNGKVATFFDTVTLTSQSIIGNLEELGEL
jgi:hypothetical protein